MVGSSPLILLNDLIINANASLPPEQQLETFGLFAVTPIGIALLISGILYFVIFGRFVLPKGADVPDQRQGLETHLHENYGIDYIIAEIYIPSTSRIIGTDLDSYETFALGSKCTCAPVDGRHDLVTCEAGSIARRLRDESVEASRERDNRIADAHGLPY